MDRDHRVLRHLAWRCLLVLAGVVTHLAAADAPAVPATSAAPAATATIPLAGLAPGARLALCGDSITEQRLYTAYVEAYLLACAGRSDVSVFEFGWGGENADQFANRITRGDLDAFMPTAISVAYGANDAGGMAWQDWLAGMWTGRLGHVIDLLHARYPATVGSVLLCSPTFLQTAADASADGEAVARRAAFNQTLERFRGLALATAQARSTGFADLRQRLQSVGTAVVARSGADFRFAGRDGIHLGPNGHLIIAYEVLKALGMRGDLATIRVDFTGGATASAGHAVESAVAGTVRLRSTRYPFCLEYERSSAPDRLATVLPELPFQRDINRFVLVVEHLPTAQADVTWGTQTSRCSRSELAAGVNLTELFPVTPFDGAFARVMALIAEQQEQERAMIKAAHDATAPRAAWTAADVTERDRRDAEVHAAVVGIEHTIRIVPVVP
jgi:hypothetical protein